jgi:hypothetical protein
MAIRRSMLQLVSTPLPERIQHAVVRWCSKGLRAQLCEAPTDELLELLLNGMDLAFLICSGYRRNIRGFQGTCVFRTDDEQVAATTLFKDGRMNVEHEARPTYDLRVSFKDAHALWSFLLSENQDILDSILANTVNVDGNLNCLYRFGFLAKDLTRRLGLAPI